MRAPTPSARDESERPTSILVSGGSPLARGAVVSTLDRVDGFTVVGHGPQSADLGRLVAEHRPHVAVLIGDTDPLPAIHALAASTPPPRVLVLAPGRGRACVAGITDGSGVAGAAGIAVSLTDLTTLVPAVRLLRSGYQVCSPLPAPGEGGSGAVRAPHTWERFDKLTGREIEVVRLMLLGWSNAEIAEALTLSGATVKSHVHSLMGKLELRSRIDIITTAYTTGFVRPR